MRQRAKHRSSLLPETSTLDALHTPKLLLPPRTAGTLYLTPPSLRGLPGELQCWLRQVGILQHAFPNSTLRLDSVICATDEVDVHHLLSCTELRGVTICSTPVADGRHRHFWQAMAALGWQHGSRLQLQAGPGVFTMLRAEPLLAAHVSEARLPWGARAGSSSMDQVSSLSSLTKLTLFNRDSVLGEAGKLDALRQLSALQSLDCQGDVMQTLLAKSVPRSWSLLTELQLSTFRAPDWSLVEQQCPQLQALATHEAIPLCLTALTSLTSHFWLPQHTDSFQCSRLSHLHVRRAADLTLLPGTLTSLSLNSVPGPPWLVAHLRDRRPRDQHVRCKPSLVHISFTSLLVYLSDIQGLVPAALHPVLAMSVTSIKLTIHPQAFSPPDMDGSMAGQHFRHLFARLAYLQRLHIHLQDSQGLQQAEDVLISTAWLPAHCRLVVTHELTCSVRIVKCASGCLSLPLSSCLADK